MIAAYANDQARAEAWAVLADSPLWRELVVPRLAAERSRQEALWLTGGDAGVARGWLQCIDWMLALPDVEINKHVVDMAYRTGDNELDKRYEDIARHGRHISPMEDTDVTGCDPA